MTKKTLLVLGASGLTGHKIMQIAKTRFNVHGTYNLRMTADKISLIKLDLSDFDELRKVISEIKPDCLINTTALHNVDYCETHSEDAFKINSKAVNIMSDVCNNIGSRLVHISTDFIFDGKNGSYSETDAPNPLSIYAQSKLEGEGEAKKCSSFAIVRPSVVYGWTPLETLGSSSSSGKPMNFALWALSKMSKGEQLQIVNDQLSSPTLADELASVITRLATKDANGIYHVAGTDILSRYDFTLKIAETMGHSKDFVKPTDSASLKQAAKRPMNSSLDCNKVQMELNYHLLDADQSLAVMRSQIELESPNLLGN